MTDEFVEEIYAVRKQLMEECGGNLDGLFELIKQWQKEDPTRSGFECSGNRAGAIGDSQDVTTA